MSNLLSLFFNYAPAVMAFVSKWIPQIQAEIPIAVSYLDAADKLATAVGTATGTTGKAAAAKAHAVITTLHTDAAVLSGVLANISPDTHAASVVAVDTAKGAL